LSGNFAPVINTSETYGFSATGGSNNVIAWSVQGGTINGSNSGSTCAVDWGPDSSGLSSITVQLACVGNVDIISDYEFFTLSGGAPPPPPPTPPPPPALVWNLTLCVGGGNATYQVDDVNLNTGVVIKDIGTGICYTVANQGAIVGPLLTNYEEHSDCTACGG
jgi:hypothetical protein